MLLWILTEPEYFDARRVVEMFEVLRERNPGLEIPFDKILVVGRAYRDIGEFERAWLVYRATVAASFASDVNVSAIMEDEGRFLASVDYLADLWQEYPDSADVVSAWFALSQALYRKAPDAHTLPLGEDGERPGKVALLERVIRMLDRFLILYPTDPLADDAAFSMASAFLDLRDYDSTVALGRRFAARWPDSPLIGSFQYMTGLGLFHAGEHAAALEAVSAVAGGTTRDRDFARYIAGQIHHARGEPAAAIDWYRRVSELYPDAAEAIAYFEARTIGLDEVSVFRPGEPVKLTLRHRNVSEAFLQVYRVDLMKLYLREKNLSRIAGIHLVGIAPTLEQRVSLGDGRDYRERETVLTLPLEAEGAYLVIARGDDRFASGLALVTPLSIEVQTFPESGRLRVNVLDTLTGGYRADVHVKAIGSEDSAFRDGQTDLRGIFVADNLHGEATVIAREGDSRYAFHRGDTWMGSPRGARVAPQQRLGDQSLDYQQNLRGYNTEMQMMNIKQFDSFRRAPQRGVQVQQAY